jgi:histidinol dehydrogenase
VKTVYGKDEARKALLEGRGLDLDKVPPALAAGIERRFGEALTPEQVVDRIVTRVKADGDEAVRELTELIDGHAPEHIEVPRPAIDAALANVATELVEALTTAAGRIESFHRRAMPSEWRDLEEGYGSLIRPLGRVGVYVPGGTAPYPSTVLMAAIPARVAGVEEVVVCTPPEPGSGLPHPTVLAAASIAGVDRVFAVGGAQAVAAMAYGTETVPKVDLICGPGNLFVTIAKRKVYGSVGIDGLYGPTETLVIADGGANPTLVAADLLAQAEHDDLAMPVLVTTSEEMAAKVSAEWRTRVTRLERSAIATASMEGRGVIAVVDSLAEAIELSNAFAPEHVSLAVENPEAYVPSIKSAGMVFVGERSHEVLGDYAAGPSHVMPTAGTARFGSGLGVHSFIRHVPVVAMDAEKSSELGRIASIIGRAEGLTAHAEAAEAREELD